MYYIAVTRTGLMYYC